MRIPEPPAAPPGYWCEASDAWNEAWRLGYEAGYRQACRDTRTEQQLLPLTGGCDTHQTTGLCGCPDWRPHG